MRIVFDIGGTKIRVAASTNGRSLSHDPVVVKTPARFDEAMALFAKVVQDISLGSKIEAVIGGVPGEFDSTKSSLIWSPNLSEWIGKPLRSSLGIATGCERVILNNDAALVGLGEAVYGAGKGFPIVAYITISTGVGGARIIREKIDEARHGFEPGHQIIDLSSHSTLESLVSGSALKARLGKDPRNVSDPSVWEKLARQTAVGLYNLNLFWSPDVIVLGGSMIIGDPAISLPLIRAELNKLPSPFPMPVIKQSTCGDFGGLFGALTHSRPFL